MLHINTVVVFFCNPKKFFPIFSFEYTTSVFQEFVLATYVGLFLPPKEFCEIFDFYCCAVSMLLVLHIRAYSLYVCVATCFFLWWTQNFSRERWIININLFYIPIYVGIIPIINSYIHFTCSRLETLHATLCYVCNNNRDIEYYST